MGEKKKQDIGSGAGVDDWIDSTDEMMEKYDISPMTNVPPPGISQDEYDDCLEQDRRRLYGVEYEDYPNVDKIKNSDYARSLIVTLIGRHRSVSGCNCNKQLVMNDFWRVIVMCDDCSYVIGWITTGMFG